MFSKKLVLFVVFIIAAIILSAMGAWDSFNEQWVDQYIRDQGISGILAYIVFCSLFIASGLPRQLAAILGGYAFGFISGVLLATLAATIGCIITFYIAKLLLRPVIDKKHIDKINSIHDFLNHRTFSMTIIIRLLPIGSNLITNIAAGITRVRQEPFFIGSFIGYLPQMIIFSLIGSGIEVLSIWKISTSIVLFIISSIISAYLYREYQLDQRVAEVR